MTTIELKEGQSALFGYGSLLLQSSMEGTLGHRYETEPYYCTVRGWKRTWDSIMPNKSFYELQAGERMYPENIVYLNVERREGIEVNGLLYVVSQIQLDAFDEREWIYDRFDITPDLTETVVTGGRAFLYGGVAPYLLRATPGVAYASIRRSYVAMVEGGLDNLGKAARTAYEASTEPLPQEWLIDDQKEPGSNPFKAARRAQLAG